MITTDLNNQRGEAPRLVIQAAETSPVSLIENLQSPDGVNRLRDSDIKKIAYGVIGVSFGRKCSANLGDGWKEKQASLDEAIHRLARERRPVAQALQARIQRVPVDSSEEGKAINMLNRMLAGESLGDEKKAKTPSSTANQSKRGDGEQNKTVGLQPSKEKLVLPRTSTPPRAKRGAPVPNSPVSPRAAVPRTHPHSNRKSVATLNTPPAAEKVPNLDAIAETLQRLLCPKGGYAKCSQEQLTTEAKKGMQEAIWAAAELASRFPKGATLVIDRGVLEQVAFSGRPFKPTLHEEKLWREFDDLWSAIRELYDEENAPQKARWKR